MRKLIFILGFFPLGWAQAAMTLVDYSKYTYSLDSTDPASVKIFAGRTSATCTESTTATCDSCALLDSFDTPGTTSGKTSAKVCNTKQISPTLLFSVTIKTDNKDLTASGNALYVVVNNLQVNNYVATTAAVNTNIQIDIPWSEICAKSSSGNDSLCTTSFGNSPVKIGFGTAYTSLAESVTFSVSFRYVGNAALTTLGCTDTDPYGGFCDYTVFPGDEKVYILNPSSTNIDTTFRVGDLTGLGATQATALDASGLRYSELLVFYEQSADYKAITPKSAQTKIPIVDNNSIKTGKISGLENNATYVFLTATVDQGGNVTHIINPTSPTCKTVTAPYENCQMAIPRKVTGLLETNKCFIATAAFGSELDPHVQDFRSFRNQYLRSFWLGRKFIKTYYTFSPDWAQTISQSKVLRIISLILLWPIWVLIKLILMVGFKKILIAGVLGSAYFYVLRMKKKKWPDLK